VTTNKLSSSQNSNLKSGIIVFILTTFSRIFGLLRELFIAYLFGTSNTADIVNVSLRLPNLFRRILGEGALSSVFVPIYTNLLTSSKRKAGIFASQIFLLLSLVLIIITSLMQIFMPEVMMLIAPGFLDHTEKFHSAVFHSRISIVYLIFICLVALIGAILQSYGRYAGFAATPILMNIGLVILTFGFNKLFNLELAVSITTSLLITGILQLLFIFLPLATSGFKFYFGGELFIRSNYSALKRFLSRLAPAIASYGIIQLNLFISQSLASFIPGAVAILNYADRVYQLPLSLIGITFGTILLPNLSNSVAKNDTTQAKSELYGAIYYSQILALPATVGLFILAPSVTAVIYERGAFSAEDTYNTALVLKIFALALPAFILIKVLNPVFYAYGDVKTPFKISLISILINIISNLILMKYFSYYGIAFGTAISAWANAGIIYYYLSRNLGICLDLRGLKSKNNLFLLIIQIAFVILVYSLNHLLLLPAEHSYYLSRLVSLFAVIALSTIMYIGVLIKFNLLSPQVTQLIKSFITKKK
jgi:putative peptidoglycan lipid II flippase